MEATHLREADPVPAEPVDPLHPSPTDPRHAHLADFGWQVLQDLFGRKRLIGLVTFLAAVTSVVGTLLMPNEFEASARVLTPDQNGSMLSALFGTGSARTAARFLGGGSTVGQYTRALAILTSRSAAEAAVDSFNLIQVYKTASEPYPREAAVTELQIRSSFGVDNEYEFLGISVRDQSPARSAALTNYFVDLLNQRNADLQSESARLYLTFIERRYQEANAALDTVLDRMKEFQRQYGVFDLPAQTAAYFTSLSSLRREQARLQIEVEALRAEYGPDASQVRAVQEALQEATRLYQQALAGGEQALPVARGAVPTVAREYAQLERERILQVTVLETVAPMYEAARMEESRRVEAVQVVDRAVPPTRKVAPRRSIIVVVATLSTFLLAVVLVVLAGQWRRRSPALRRRLAESAPAATR